MPMQDSRLNGLTTLADLLFGLEPIAEGITFPSGVPSLKKNLVCAPPDLLARTDADAHGFLLLRRLTGGMPASSLAIQRPLLEVRATQGLLRANGW
jgi:hypothetical protein